MNEGTTEQQHSERGLREAFVTMLSERMAKADWYYQYSDDFSVWNRESVVINRIRDDIKLLSKLDGGFSDAQNLWDQHVPPYSISFDPMWEPSKQQEDSIFRGRITKEDAPGVREILHKQQEAGNRFVAFERGLEVITKDRFIGFPSAIEARNFAHENSKAGKIFIVRSISEVQHEIQKAMAPDKDKVLKEISERLHEYSGKQNRSHGQDMSR